MAVAAAETSEAEPSFAAELEASLAIGVKPGAENKLRESDVEDAPRMASADLDAVSAKTSFAAAERLKEEVCKGCLGLGVLLPFL